MPTWQGHCKNKAQQSTNAHSRSSGNSVDFGAVVGASARAVDSDPGGVSEVEGLWGAGCAVGGFVSLPINVHFMAEWVESSGWHQASLG